MGRSVAPCLVLALLALSSSVEARDLMGLNGHRNGVAFADQAYYYVSNGNGTWSMAAPSLTVGLLGSYKGVSFTTAQGIVFPMAAQKTGIASVAFPSKGLGIAVGMPAPGGGAITAAANNKFTTAGPTFTKTVPSIMMSLDGGNNWMQTDNINPATTPANTPDLFTVFCPTKLVCWAAGGNFPDPTQAAASVHTAAILMTFDGGLSWTYTLCPDTFGAPLTGWTGAWPATPVTPAITATDGCPSYSGYYLPQGGPKVGMIFDIASDSSAMHVFAVGAYGANSLETGAILYSGNGGVSWVQQVAPAFMAVPEYSLFGVSVATGKVAFACGGQARLSNIGGDATGQNGVILMTVNGGYSWVPQYVVGNYTQKAPAGVAGALPFSSKLTLGSNTYLYSTPLLTDIFFNRNKNVNSTVWAVGLSLYDALPGGSRGAFSGSPGLKSDYAVAQSTLDYMPCYSIFAAVLRNGLASTNTTLSFTLISPLSLPPSYAESNACGNDLYGVVFDNTNHGWIYGRGTILVTQNAGLTWQYETPNSLMVIAGNGQPANPESIYTIANVPSNY